MRFLARAARVALPIGLLAAAAVLMMLVVLSGPTAPAVVGEVALAAHGVDVTIRPQSPDEAFDYLWMTLRDMPFFRDNGYQVGLPDDTRVQRIAKGEIALSDVDREDERGRFRERIYRAEAFGPALRALTAGKETVARALREFRAYESLWGFRIFPRYTVQLTLYGPGGSFDPERGVITLFTTDQGRFKGGGGIHTIVHEMVHLGIERDIVQRYALTHWEKERLVDLVCRRGLGHLLPDYRLQSSGESALDPFIDEAALRDLPSAVQRYVEANPR